MAALVKRPPVSVAAVFAVNLYERTVTHRQCPMCHGTGSVASVINGHVVQTACQYWGATPSLPANRARAAGYDNQHDERILVLRGASNAARMAARTGDER